jgi:uncharacterized protein
VRCCEDGGVPEIAAYRHGVPNWVDVATTDVPTAAAFYAGLFGWEVEDQGEHAGHYHLFRRRGLEVAGLGPVQGEGMAPVWTTYLAVDDVDAACARASSAGGAVVMGPVDVLDAGRMAVAIDPAGAAVSFWQAGRTIGSRLVNEPGAPVWHELVTRDAAAAEPFYAAVLGWTYRPMDPVAPERYHLFEVAGRAVGGIVPASGDSTGDVPSRWIVYFMVDDTDTAVARARMLGGTAAVEPFDTPAGRAAVLVDPTGAAFSVIHATATDDPDTGWQD